MELKDYEKKVGHSVDEMSYKELLGYFEINKDKSIDFNLSYSDAYWLERLFDEKIITYEEYSKGLMLLREAVATGKIFNRIFIEAEDPTGKTKDHWEFYLTD